MDISELYIQTPPQDLERLIAHPAEASNYVFPPGQDNDVSNDNPLRYHCEENWHVLLVLIAKSWPPVRRMKPARTLFGQLGRKLFKINETRGIQMPDSLKPFGIYQQQLTQNSLTPRYLTVQEVQKTAEVLSGISKKTLLSHFNLDELIDESTYKLNWWEELKAHPETSSPNLKTTLQGIADEFEELIEFFKRTAKTGGALLIVGLC